MRSASRVPAVGAAILVLVLYLVALGLLPRQVFWHPDSGSKYLTVDMLRWGGAPVIGYPGRGVDPRLEFYPSRCGPIYPTANPDGSLQHYWPPWFSYAARPFYVAFGLNGVYLVPLLAGWLTALVTGWIAWKSSPSLAAPAILLVGLATPLGFYSVSFAEHTPATLFGTAALAVAVLLPPRSPRALIAMTALVVPAVILRIEMMAFAVSLWIAWLAVATADRMKQPVAVQAPTPVRPRRVPPWLTTIAGLLAAAAAILVLIESIPERYDHYFTLLRSAWGGVVHKLPFLSKSLVDVFMTSIPQPSPLSAAWVHKAALAAGGILVVTPFVRAGRTEALLTLGALVVLFQYSALTALVTRPYIGSQGALAAAPFIAVAVFAIPSAWRRRDYPMLLVGLTTVIYAAAAFVVLFVLRVALDGLYLVGLDGGVRYMLTLYPVATVAAVGGLAAYRASDRAPFVRSAFTVLALALVLVAAQYQFRGIRSLYDNSALLTRWSAAARGHDSLVTDVWWLPASLAPLFLDEPFYCVTSFDDLRHWIHRAYVGKVRSFTYMTPKRVEPGQIEKSHLSITEESSEFVEGMWFYRFTIGRHPPSRERSDAE